uniref:Uncharacterized protein n=1 Tax=Panagrellus redivivus TaxID=6233 RepID=A0A7E4VRD9_PANRE
MFAIVGDGRGRRQRLSRSDAQKPSAIAIAPSPSSAKHKKDEGPLYCACLFVLDALLFPPNSAGNGFLSNRTAQIHVKDEKKRSFFHSDAITIIQGRTALDWTLMSFKAEKIIASICKNSEFR